MTLALRAVVALLLVASAAPASAHESRPGYLELRQVDASTYDMLWKQPALGELRLGIDPVFPPECVVGLSRSDRPAPGALVVRATVACDGGLAGKTVSVAGLDATLTDVLLRVYHEGGETETHLLRPFADSVTIGTTTGGVERAAAYLRLGVAHIVQGVDHLLFVLGLLLIVKSRLKLLQTITAFTLAHSLTLALATLGYARAPVLPLNAAIALSILFLGPEIVRSWRGGTSLTLRQPWLIAFAFGLLHGFGFASGLTSMGLPAAEIPLALLLFNLGVEAGQLLFVALVLLLERSFRTLEVRWPAWAQATPGYVVGSLGAYWTIQRTVALVAGIR